MMKPIPGYNGKYLINESGVVINEKGHVMRTAESNAGYLRTALEHINEDGIFERKNKSIHRLVAQTFLENPDNLPVVMHKDNDKLNNHVSNLKYGTYAENAQQAMEDGLLENRKIKQREAVFGSKSVYEVYNKDESDIIICIGREQVADTIQYSLISLKNMVGNGREITLGPYKGYMIRRTGEMAKIIDDFSQNSDEYYEDYAQRLSLDEGVKPQAYGGGKIQLQLEEKHSGDQAIELEIIQYEKRSPFVFS